MNKGFNKRIPFGLRDGILIQVSEVKPGLACGCVCPSCKQKLQANKGNIVSHYFSHDPSAKENDCRTACETAIHLMAKQIIREDGCLVVPALNISIKQSDANDEEHVESELIEDQSRVNFDKIELEKTLGDIRPDVTGYANNDQLLIEVAVTHFADYEKKQKIRNSKLYAIEIDLKSVHYTITKEELRELINGTKAKKQWISNPKAINAKSELKTILNKKIRAINERIFRKKRKYLRKIKNQTLNATNKKSYSRISDKPVIKTHYKERWFVCEVCRSTFTIPTRDAPYSIEGVTCPKCTHAVSVKSCMA